MTYPVCPCDAEPIAAPTNLPELSYISYRAGDFVSFRQAVLTPLFTPATPQPLPVEQTLSVDGLPVWRTDGVGDLAVMIAEWFAYVADVITFYNERIANQDYLRTADLDESVNNLIALLGYRPRPAIGAYGALAALLSPGPTFGGRGVTLPSGLQFQSKPTPGLAPQTFELTSDTLIVAPDQFPAEPPPLLLGQVTTPVDRFSPYHAAFGLGGKGWFGPIFPIMAGEWQLLLQGAVKTIDAGAPLRLRVRDGSSGPWLATVVNVSIAPAPSGGGQQTTVILTLSGDPTAGLSAAQASLESPNQIAPVWSWFSGAISGAIVHLASLQRQIRPGDWLLFTGASGSPAPVLAQVASTADAIWDANGASASDPTIPPATTTTVSASGTITVTTTASPIPVLHTQLTLTSDLPAGWDDADPGGVTVQFGWVSVGVLLDQPFGLWSGTPASLAGTGAQPFPFWSDQPIQLQDATGLGVLASGSASGGGFSLALAALPDPTPSLQPPFLVLPNLLPVTRGKTVAKEILGSGDSTNPAQDFELSQSPVTYLQQGAGYASTIDLTVNGLPWTEVSSFYGQSPTATVFVTREDNSGDTHVMFGDGVTGARLPTGVNNVVATYRVGAGADSPPAGKLTVIAKPYPGLRSVLNPVAVIGGADPDPPDQIRRYAPRSVLTFGRAVSVFDFEALAAQTPGVTRASAVWAWNDARQRALVTVYVGDTPGAKTAAITALQAAGDPNRPVQVVQAAEVDLALTLTLLVTPGMDQTIIGAAVATALTDTEVGLFGSWNMGVGQIVFDSQIEAAVLSVSGAVAITAMSLEADGAASAGPLHSPGEGGYFTLDPADINLTMEADPNG
jgi:hypothetical protein